jgi:hypothetical protein
VSGPRRPYQLENPLLRRHGLSIARYACDRCERAWPELEARYGERGRHHMAEDHFWHLDYLDSAAAAGEPAVFAEYTDWLVGLLTARGLERRHIAGTYEFLAEAIERVECPLKSEENRRTLLALLRENRARILVGHPAG